MLTYFQFQFYRNYTGDASLKSAVEEGKTGCRTDILQFSNW